MAWQRRLFAGHFALGNIPTKLDIPTGIGKTSVIVIWLLALAFQATTGVVRLPRRLVYVVNRRTVVDQATDLTRNLREKLRSASDDDALVHVRAVLRTLCIDADDAFSPLAISTLRGELADNREWQGDPARPAIIIGTVDMIGSRLLFSGYGVSQRMRPFHAGLLGQDTLLVHDEAHLEPAFGELVHNISRIQCERNEPRPLHLLELSATQRGQADATTFTLSEEEKQEVEVRRRITARKTLLVVEANDRSAALATIVRQALDYKENQSRVLIYVRSPREAKDIVGSLIKQVSPNRAAILTGTIRGIERDALVAQPIFKGFMSNPNRQPLEGTEYLVPLHRGFDWLIFGHFRMGRFSGATSSSMLRATPGWRRIKPARSMVRTI